MKKVLFASTALAAVALTGTAQAADPIKLGLGGYINLQAINVSQDNDAGRRTLDIWREGEVFFAGSTKLDNGITVGIQVDLEAETCGDQIDESFIHFSGGFGRIEAGATRGPGFKLLITPPASDPNFDGLLPNFVPVAQPSGNSVSTTFVLPGTLGSGAGTAEKLSYTTPKFGGFQAGVAYTPNSTCEWGTCGTGGFPSQESTSAAQLDDMVQVGAQFSGDLGGAKVALGGGYDTGSAGGTASDGTIWGVGARAAMAGFTVGAYYGKTEFAGSTLDQTNWQLGASYGVGALTGGVTYTSLERDTGGTDDDLSRIQLGAAYSMGPGVDLRGSVGFYQFDGATAADQSDATVFAVGTRMAF